MPVLWVVFAVAIFAVLVARPVAAHDVPTEAVVRMSVQADGPVLRIFTGVPATLFSDANLPRLENGLLDAEKARPLVELVASDLVRNLDVWEDHTPLAVPVSRARVNSDGTTVDFDFEYRIKSDRDRFSARLNGFRSLSQPVRTIARVATPGGETRTFNVTGSPQRIFFTPRWTETARRFAALALQRLLESNLLWFLFALVVPLRSYKIVAAAFAALVAGESIAILASALGVATPNADFLATAQTLVAMSLIFIGVQNITHGHTRWAWPVALWFGLIDGFSVGAAVRDSVQFAATHVVFSLIVFGLALVVGQLWVILLARPIVEIARRWTRSEQMAAAILSAPVIHAGLQGMLR